VKETAPAALGGPEELIARIAELEDEGLDHKQSLKRAAREFGMAKSEAYRVVESAKK